MNGLFWNSRRSRTMTKAEAERFRSPEETGRRLVVALRAWLARAVRDLPAEACAWYCVELDPPEWLDSGYPHLALNECRRLVNGIPDAAPGWMDWTPEQARAVAVLHAARDTVVATAKVPAPEALLLLERALQLGIELARAHVEPWEAAAITGNKIKTNAKEGHAETHGTPEQKTERWARLQAMLNETMARSPALSLTEARRRTAKAAGVSYTTMRRHTTDPRK